MDIRRIIKEEIDDFDWVSQHMETVPDEPHYLALVQCYGSDVLDGIDTEENPTYDHYGVDVFETADGREYAIGDTDKFWQALYDYYDNLIDEVGIDGWNVDVESYLYMYPADINFWATDLTDNDIEGYDNDDMVERSSYSSEFEELGESIDELNDRILSREDDLLDIEDEESDEYTDLEEEIENMREDLMRMEARKEDIYDEAKQEVWNDLYQTHKDGLERDPIDYLVNDLGIYSGYEELYDNNILHFEKDQFCEDLANEGHYGEIASYDGDYCETEVDGTTYISVRIN